MAALTRKTAKLFGTTAGAGQVGKFGSFAAGLPATTTDPAQMQTAEWLQGWYAAIVGANSPAIEDMNAVHFVLAYQIAYMFEKGIGEWDAATTYYIGSLVNQGGDVYGSLTNNNLNNAIPDPANWRKLASGIVMTTIGDLIFADADGDAARLPGNTTTVRNVLTQTGNGTDSAAPEWKPAPAPTVQQFSSGSGTYTTPSGVLYLRVRMVGGGGGGGGGEESGGGAGSGGTGGNTTFGDAAANGGGGGTVGAGGSNDGGTATLGTIGTGLAFQGAIGTNGASTSNTNFFQNGGQGASTPFGGGGGGGAGNGPGYDAKAGTGAGGGGGGTSNNGGQCGGGGCAGGFVDMMVFSPAASFSYAVGAAGSAGTAGTGGFAGGAGASGYLIVEEYYI